MGKVLITGTGSGGVTSDDVTAARADVVAGKKTITTDSGDEVVEGTLPDMPRSTQATKLEHNGTNFHMYLPNGAYRQTGLIWDSLANLRQTIGYTDSSKVLVGTTIAGLAGTMPSKASAQIANSCIVYQDYLYYRIPYGYYPNAFSATECEVRIANSVVRPAIGYTNAANVRNNTTIAGLRGTMPEQGGSTTLPGTANKTVVAANRYVNGNVIVSGDPNLVAGNIKKGARIFGVTGTFEGWVASVNDLYKYGQNPGGFQAFNSYTEVKFNTGMMTVNQTVNASNAGIWSNGVNLSGKNSLKVECSGENSRPTTMVVEVTSSHKNEDTAIAQIQYTVNAGGVPVSVITLNVANINQVAYVYIHSLYSKNTYWVYRVWVE